MHDVAREAGVSAQTVSRVIRSPGLVKKETRNLVHATIERLGYVPDSTASDLASNRSRFVAAVIPSVSMSIYEDAVRALSTGLLAAGYQLLLGNTEYSLASEEATIFAFLGRRPEAMVVVGVDHTDRANALMRQSGIPIIETMELTDTPIDTVVGYSNRTATAELTQLLLSRGYKHIVFAGGKGEARGIERQQGYLQAMKESGLPLLVLETGDHPSFINTGISGLKSVLEQHPLADAIIFNNDASASGAILECQRAGIQVPCDLAICGFGDFDISAHLNPGLTTVRILSHDIGKRAAQVIIDRLNGIDSHPKIIDIGFEIVERGSIREA